MEKKYHSVVIEFCILTLRPLLIFNFFLNLYMLYKETISILYSSEVAQNSLLSKPVTPSFPPPITGIEISLTQVLFQHFQQYIRNAEQFPILKITKVTSFY